MLLTKSVVSSVFLVGVFLVPMPNISGAFSTLQNSLSDQLPFFNFEYDKALQNPPVSAATAKVPSPRFRLPLNVIPRHYILKHQPILDEIDGLTRFTAPSEVTISIQCVEQTSTIILHSCVDKITINEPEVKVTNGSFGVQINIVNQTYGPDDFYIITLATPLEAFQNYEIFIPFVAIASLDSPFGLSAPSYVVDPDNPKESYMTVTTLEPHYARRVLPCFDEPSLKATFDIIVGHTAAYRSLSHTPITETKVDGEWFWDHYERTVRMPTYLLCMVVVSATDYAVKMADPILYERPVGAWALKTNIDRGGGDFAAEVSAKSLDYFQRTYRFPYDLSKLDSITIPKFPAGALENWGLNTYRPDVLVWLASENSQAAKASSASTISHEISHQWFGNLVSCAFWEQIWLNEGLANYMSYKGVEHTNPEFEPYISFPSDSVQPAMRADQGPNTHPVKFEKLPDNWMAIFDTISYSKGGSLIRMAEGFLTDEILTEGFVDFLGKMAYKGADQDDLFASLDKAVSAASVNPLPSDLTVKKIFDTWTLQSGYPLIHVSRAGSERIFLSQEQFALNPSASSRSNNMWNIPVKVVTKADSDVKIKIPNLWIRTDDILLNYGEGIDTSQWIMINPDATGFYRVFYGTDLLGLIQTQLVDDPTEISPGSRSQLLDDYWNFALAKYAHIHTFLDLTKYLIKEINLVVWSSVLRNLRPTFTILSGSVGFAPFATYFRPMIEAALDQVGWEQAADAIGAPVILRSLLVDWACGLESDKCLSESERLFSEWEAQPDPNPIPIPIDLQSVYFCGAVAKLNKPAFDFILEQYKTTTAETLKLRLLGALTCATSDTILEELLNLALVPSSSGIRLIDQKFVFQKVAENPAGREIIYNFIRIHLETVGGNLFASIYSTFSSHMHLESDIVKLDEFVENKPIFDTPTIISSLLTSRRNIRANIEWMESTGNLIVDWMNSNTKN